MEVLGHARMRTTTDTYSTSCRPSAATPRTAWAEHCGTDLRLGSRRRPGHHDRVTGMNLVLQALAESGLWHGSDDREAELVRVENRRAALKAGITVPISTGSGDRMRARRMAGLRTSRGEGAATHAPSPGPWAPSSRRHSTASCATTMRAEASPMRGSALSSAPPRTGAYDHGRPSCGGTGWIHRLPKWHCERRRPLCETENGLVRRVELRGLAPLTPTLPGRHDRVHGGPSQFHKPSDQRTNTAADGYE
jgi:hypothetical protein